MSVSRSPFSIIEGVPNIEGSYIFYISDLIAVIHL